MNTDKQSRSGDSGGAASDTSESVAPLARYFLWVERQSSINRLIRLLVYVCVILFLIDLVWHRHTKVPGEGLWGYHAIVGFFSFSLLVIGARFLRLFIRRDESFYAPHCVDAEEYPDADTQHLTHEQRSQDSLLSFGNDLLGREPTASKQPGASS